jgi:hypothetical protein
LISSSLVIASSTFLKVSARSLSSALALLLFAPAAADDSGWLSASERTTRTTAHFRADDLKGPIDPCFVRTLFFFSVGE